MTWITAAEFTAFGGVDGAEPDYHVVWYDDTLMYIFFTDNDAVDGTRNLYAMEAYFDGSYLSFVNPISGLRVVKKITACDLGAIQFVQRTPSGYGVFILDSGSGAGTQMFAVDGTADNSPWHLDDHRCSWRADELVGFITGTGAVVFGTITTDYGTPVLMDDTSLFPTNGTLALLETAGDSAYYVIANADTAQIEYWKCQVGVEAILLDSAYESGHAGSPHSVDNQIDLDPRILGGVGESTSDVELFGLTSNLQLTNSIETTVEPPEEDWTGVWHGMVQNIGFFTPEQPPDYQPPDIARSMSGKTSVSDPDYYLPFSFDPDGDPDADQIGYGTWSIADFNVTGAPVEGTVQLMCFGLGVGGSAGVVCEGATAGFDAGDTFTSYLDDAYRYDWEFGTTADRLFVRVVVPDGLGGVTLVAIGGMGATIDWVETPDAEPGATLLSTGEYLFTGTDGTSETSSFSPTPDLGVQQMNAASLTVPTGRYTAIVAPTEYGGTPSPSVAGTLAIHYLVVVTDIIQNVLRVYPRSDGLGASSTFRVYPVSRSYQASNRVGGGYL